MSGPTERLLRCLRLDATPAAVAASCADWSPDAWREVVDDAVRHEVEALLHDRVSRATPPAHCPAEIATRLRELYCCSALDGRRVHGDLAVLLRAFRREGIPVVVLKGAYLAGAVYGDVALRPMADLDLLVRAHALARAERLLLELGYGPRERTPLDAYPRGRRHLDPFHKPGAAMVEVHHALIDTDGPCRVDTAGLWRRARRVEIAGEPALALAPEDLLLHLSLHAGYTHRFGATHRAGLPLKHVFDIALAVQRHGAELDWALLARLCASSGAGRFVFCALALAADVLRAQVDAAGLAAIPHRAADRAMLGVIREQLLGPPLSGAPTVPKTYRLVARGDGADGVLRPLVGELLPEPARLRKRYRLRRQSPRLYVLYFVHALHMLRTNGSAACGAFFRTRRFRALVTRYDATGRHVDAWAEGRPRRG